LLVGDRLVDVFLERNEEAKIVRELPEQFHAGLRIQFVAPQDGIQREGRLDGWNALAQPRLEMGKLTKRVVF
jgi:hypothetical protein